MSWACKTCGSTGKSDSDLEYVPVDGDLAVRCPKCRTTIVVLSSVQTGPGEWTVSERTP